MMTKMEKKWYDNILDDRVIRLLTIIGIILVLFLVGAFIVDIVNKEITENAIEFNMEIIDDPKRYCQGIGYASGFVTDDGYNNLVCYTKFDNKGLKLI